MGNRARPSVVATLLGTVPIVREGLTVGGVRVRCFLPTVACYQVFCKISKSTSEGTSYFAHLATTI